MRSAAVARMQADASVSRTGQWPRLGPVFELVCRWWQRSGIWIWRGAQGGDRQVLEWPRQTMEAGVGRRHKESCRE